MRRLPTIAACALVLGLAACVTAPEPVRPIALAPGEWRVSLTASDARNARLGALREAAGLTLAEGGDWFRVLGREGAGAREPGAGPGLTSDLFADEDDISRRSLDIAIGHGPKPAGLEVYDAREVAARLGGASPRPRVPSQAI